MELYNKESLKQLEGKSISTYYLPKVLFEGSKFGTIRLETKMAYVAILDTLIKKSNYTKDGIAYIKVDNPEIAKTLANLANKNVDQDKVNKYLEELNVANLIDLNKKDIFVYNID